MCITAISRVAAACLVSAGMVGSSVLPASASSHDDEDYAWVKVCQYVYHHDHHKDYTDGEYSINWYGDEDDESDDGSEDGISVSGWNDCSDKYEVPVGDIKVTVDRYPDGAERHGRDWVRFYAEPDYTYTVKVSYDDSDEGHDRVIGLQATP
jgi:hypothetical protein